MCCNMFQQHPEVDLTDLDTFSLLDVAPDVHVLHKHHAQGIKSPSGDAGQHLNPITHPRATAQY
jgi:hypothetical protein